MAAAFKYGLYSLLISIAVCMILKIDLEFALAFAIFIASVLLVLCPAFVMLWSRLQRDKIKAIRAEVGEKYPIKCVSVWERKKRTKRRFLMGLDEEKLLAVESSRKRLGIMRLRKSEHKEIVIYGQWFIVRLKDDKRGSFVFTCRHRLSVVREFVMAGWNVSGVQGPDDSDDSDDSDDENDSRDE